MNITALIIQLVSGAVGGNIAGAAMSKFNLGPIGNSIAGIVGGGVGGPSRIQRSDHFDAALRRRDCYGLQRWQLSWRINGVSPLHCGFT
jgi:hypothetical protein